MQVYVVLFSETNGSDLSLVCVLMKFTLTISQTEIKNSYDFALFFPSFVLKLPQTCRALCMQVATNLKQETLVFVRGTGFQVTMHYTSIPNPKTWKFLLSYIEIILIFVC